MKALLILLSAAATLASDTTSPTSNPANNTSFPVTSLMFTIIFGLVILINIFWIIKAARAKQNLSSSDTEKQSLVTPTLPEGVVSTNISVSAQNRPSLLAELRHDEHLVWAHENLTPLRIPILIFLSLSLLFAVTGFATALCFMIIFESDVNDIALLSMWMPFLGMISFFLLMSEMMRRRSGTIIYALTSKRVFNLNSMPAGWCGGKTETVQAYDLDGIHQSTITRREDGSGTLTFSAAAVADEGAYHGHHYNLGAFAFVNIPNVTSVKDMIEQYKTLTKKQAGNQ